MGDKMHSVDDAKTIINAFESFDPNVTGKISHDEFKKILGMGKSKFNDREVCLFPWQVVVHRPMVWEPDV